MLFVLLVVMVLSFVKTHSSVVMIRTEWQHCSVCSKLSEIVQVLMIQRRPAVSIQPSHCQF